MSADPVVPLQETLVTEREQWLDGPPHALFKELRGGCPVHWTSKITEYPEEDGFWSVTTADDVHAVSRDWETYSSATGFTALTNAILPLELSQAMFIGMDPPKHDRLKALFQRGFTPKRINEHEPAIREITREVLDRLEGRETCDLVGDVAQPVVARVIGSFMGTAPEDDAIWARLMNQTLGAGDPDMNPEGVQTVMERDVPEIFRRCSELIAARREHPTDDLMTVLVQAEIDGSKLEEHEIVMGFFLLVAAGNDSTKATYSSGMRALLEDKAQMRQGRLRGMVATGKTEEADKMMADAVQVSTEAELNAYAYGLLAQQQTDKAVDIFLLNTKRHPESANAWDSLGEGYFTKGDKMNATAAFKKSLSLNPPAPTKVNSEKFLKQMGAM